MSNFKITDLPPFGPEHIAAGWPLAVIDERGHTRRVVIGDHTYETEEQAIERVKEIYRARKMVAFIIPVKW